MKGKEASLSGGWLTISTVNRPGFRNVHGRHVRPMWIGEMEFIARSALNDSNFRTTRRELTVITGFDDKAGDCFGARLLRRGLADARFVMRASSPAERLLMPGAELGAR